MDCSYQTETKCNEGKNFKTIFASKFAAVAFFASLNLFVASVSVPVKVGKFNSLLISLRGFFIPSLSPFREVSMRPRTAKFVPITFILMTLRQTCCYHPSDKVSLSGV
jgi:hypothetical protein